MGIALNRYPLTVENFNFLAEQGKFNPDARLELIEGEIHQMLPIGSLHARCVNFLSNTLFQVLVNKYIVSIQNPIVVDDLNQLQPDIAVLNYQKDFYKYSLPYAKDVLLVIEVADSTVLLDRNVKFPKYAYAGIAEAWLIDLQNEQIEIHGEPNGFTYSNVKTYQRGEQVVSETMPDVKFSVNDILG
jgi:Uma2 family endonuclease